MEKFISVKHVIQKLLKERFHVRQLLTIYMLMLYQLNLKVLKKLEQIIIARRIVFEKIVVMPKGQQRKIKGAICNVPVDCDQTCNILPRPPERSGIILLKLKRKIQFTGHVYFEAVRPEIIMTTLDWLKANNILYKDIQIDCTSSSTELTKYNE